MSTTLPRVDLDALTPASFDSSAHVPDGATRLLDHGFIQLVKTNCPTPGEADDFIAWCARRSYQDGTKATRSNEDLLRYLLTEGHMSPFEHPVFTLHVFLPLFVQNQWVRHRTGSYSILSLRYSLVADLFYIPQQLRMQSLKNKQASEGALAADMAVPLEEKLAATIAIAVDTYRQLIAAGVAREVARGVIPTCVYSDMVVTMDLRNLLHLVDLRYHPHAQAEFQVFAREIERMLGQLAPATMAVYQELRAKGVRF